MSSLQEIEAAITQLPPGDLVALREWFAELDAAEWDRQFEEGVADGRLDKLSEQAIKAHSEAQTALPPPLARRSY